MKDGFTPAQKFRLIRQIVTDPGLKGRVPVALGVHLVEKYLFDNPDCWPAQDTLATELGCSVDAIGEAGKMLAARGHFEVTPGRGRKISTRYRPILKACADSGKPRLHARFSEPITAEKTPVAARKNPAHSPRKTPAARPLNPRRENPIDSPAVEGEAPAQEYPASPVVPIDPKGGLFEDQGEPEAAPSSDPLDLDHDRMAAPILAEQRLAFAEDLLVKYERQLGAYRPRHWREARDHVERLREIRAERRQSHGGRL